MNTEPRKPETTDPVLACQRFEHPTQSGETLKTHRTHRTHRTDDMQRPLEQLCEACRAAGQGCRRPEAKGH